MMWVWVWVCVWKTIRVCQKYKKTKQNKKLSNNENKPQEEYNRDQQDSRLGEWRKEKDEMVTLRLG